MNQKLKQIHQYIHARAKHGFWHIVDSFIPHARNNYQPHALQHRALFGYSALLILLKLVVVLAPIALPSSSLFSSAITAQNVFNLTNQARENLGVHRLAYNQVLEDAANRKAQDMLNQQYFAHVSPAGVTPWKWFQDVGYKYRHAGENLAVHFHEAEDVQAAWMASPSHRANIIADKYDEIGVGVATGSFEGTTATFVVQMFGAPRQALAEPSETQPVTSTQVRTVPKSRDVVRVSVKRDEPAEAVVAQLAGEQISLEETEPGVWEADMNVNTRVVQENGEPLTAVFIDENGEAEVEQLAYLAPGDNTQRLYIFNEGTERFVKIFNSYAIGNLEDKVQTFYLAFIAFLAAGILAYLVMLKLRIHRPSVISHALAVLGLAILLLLV